MTTFEKQNIQMMEDIIEDKVIYSKYAARVQTSIEEIYPMGLSYGPNSIDRGGDIWQFVIPCGSANIVTKQSYVQYIMKFTMLIKRNGIYKMQNGFWMIFDEYKNGEQVILCNSPMMSTCVIKSSTAQYQSINQIDEELFQQTALRQAYFDKEQLNKMNSTFFDAKDVIIIDARSNIIGNITVTDAKDYKQYHKLELYKTFKIPLEFCNQFFTEDVMSTAYMSNTIELRMHTQAHDYAKIFGRQKADTFMNDILVFEQANIVEVKLFVERKQCDMQRDDMLQLPQMTYMVRRTDIQALATQACDQSSMNTIISRPHQSVNNLVFYMYLPDEGERESLYLKQKFTLFSAEQLLKIKSGEGSQTLRANFLGETQLFIGSKGIWLEKIRNLAQFLQSNYNEFGCLNSYHCGSNPAFQTHEWLQKYAIFAVNLEAYSQLEGVTDCALDGISTHKTRLQIQYRLHSYIQSEMESYPYKKAEDRDILHIKNNFYAFYVQQQFDTLVTIKQGIAGSNQTGDIIQ